MDDTKSEEKPFIKITKTEKFAECEVNDNFMLGNRNAIFQRNIDYKNNSDKEFDINFAKNQFQYSGFCRDFTCRVNDKNFDLSIKDQTFYKIVWLDLKVLLKPGESLSVKIRCTWKNFVQHYEELNFKFELSDRCFYQLTLHNLCLQNSKYFASIDRRKTQEERNIQLHPNSVVFHKPDVSINNPFELRLIVLKTPKTIPTLKYFMEPSEKFNLSNYVFVLIQHLLSDFTHFVEGYIDNGTDPHDIFVIGIPYSTKDHTVEYLKLIGLHEIFTPLSYSNMEKVVEQVLRKAIEKAEKEKKRIVIIEDGGYAVPIIHKSEEFQSKQDLIVGAVEQTANGIWRDQEVLKETSCLFPIINVAESDLKKEKESPLIGQAVRINIEKTFGRDFVSLNRKKILLVGYGSTGSRVANEIDNIYKNIVVFDVLKERREKAKQDGLQVIEKIEDGLGKSDIIIEATGRSEPWLNEEELATLKHGCYFISSSSKRLGINYAEFKRSTKKQKMNFPGVRC